MGKRNAVQKLWDKIPKAWKVELISVVQTFIAAFIGALAISFEVTGEFSWTQEAILAALLAAARSGVKAVWLLVARQVASK